MTDIETTQQAPAAPEKVGRSKVVLHIGTHKTATTTIQDTFWENADLLAEHGMIYPRMGRAKGHHGLVRDWAHLPEVYALPDGSRAALKRINDAYAHQPVTVFLSSEEFSRADPAGATNFGEVRALLSDFDEIEVLCTLRTQWQFIQSIYLEISKKANPPRPPHFCESAIKNGMTAGLWADYGMLLDKLEETFVPEEIAFFDFDTVVKAPGGIIGTYLRHLGVPLEAEALIPLPGGAANVSLPALVSWAANMLAMPHKAPDWLTGQVEEVMVEHMEGPVRTCLFTRKEFGKLEAHFAPRNARLQERRAKVQPDFALTEPDIERLRLFRDTMPSAIWTKVARQQVKTIMDQERGGVSG